MGDWGYDLWMEAFEEGKRNGEKKAKMKFAKELARRLLDMGFAPDQIAKAVDFDLETVKQWLSEAISA